MVQFHNRQMRVLNLIYNVFFVSVNPVFILVTFFGLVWLFDFFASQCFMLLGLLEFFVNNSIFDNVTVFISSTPVITSLKERLNECETGELKGVGSVVAFTVLPKDKRENVVKDLYCKIKSCIYYCTFYKKIYIEGVVIEKPFYICISKNDLNFFGRHLSKKKEKIFKIK